MFSSICPFSHNLDSFLVCVCCVLCSLDKALLNPAKTGSVPPSSSCVAPGSVAGKLASISREGTSRGQEEEEGEKAKGAAQREEGRVSAHAGEGEVGTQGMRSLVPLLSGMSTTDRPSERQLIFGASDVHESPGQSV